MKEHIERTVERLHRRFGSNDPFETARALGINVREIPLVQLKGFYLVALRERYIYINSALCDEEKRIVCAHELGHDQLHRDFARYTPLRETMIYDMTCKPEREANLFAALFLIRDCEIRVLRGYSTAEMAMLLHVQEPYILLRLETMHSKN